jgi:PST family polysaccharide transporter
MTAYAIVTAVGELGLASCLIRADLDIDMLGPTLTTVSLATSLIQAGALVAFAGPIAVALGAAAAADPIKVMGIVTIIVGIFAVPNCQLVRDFKQNKLFLAQVVGFVPSTLVLLLLARSGSGAMAFAWSMVVGQFVSGCVVLASVPKVYLPGMARYAMSILLRFGLPLGAANIVNFLLLNVDYALIGHLMGAVALGTYMLAFNVASWPNSILGNLINNVSMPAFSRVKQDFDLLKTAVANALRALSLAVLPISALTMVLARPLILTLYGAKWAASAEVLSILTLYGAISIICLLFANILAGLGLSKHLLFIQLIWLVALVPGMVLGVHRDGIVGAAIAHVIVVLPVVLPCYLIVLMRTTAVRFTILVKAISPAFLASTAAALVARFVSLQFTYPFVQLVIGLATGGLIYIIAVAPLAMELLSRGGATDVYAKRILRPYRIAARLVGLPVAGQPKHSSKPGGPFRIHIGTIGGTAPGIASVAAAASADAAQSMAALELLMSLSKPQSMVRPAAVRPPSRTRGGIRFTRR